jgi:hypothetical protein
LNSQTLRPLPVLLVSGLLGFCVGMFRFPTWQVAVETSQVVAHLVKYPAGNPFYIYHTKLWTVLHQICALFLLAGVSEITLSRILSGLLGMASFQALALVVYALSTDVLLAVMVPFLIFFSRIADHGVVYPVILLGTDHTYGSLGLSVVVLVVGLFATGRTRSAAFLMGLAPAVHPSLGMWLWLTAGVALAWDRQSSRAARYFFAGCAITALSLLVQLTVTYDVPHVDSAISDRYVRAFIGFWDPHRGPVNPLHLGVLINVAALTLSSIWLAGFARQIPRPAQFLLRMVIVSASISLLCVVISRIPMASLPVTLLVLMPARLLNFNVMTYVALLFGLLGLYRDRVWAHVLMACLAAGLLCDQNSMLWESLEWAGFPPSTHKLDPTTVLALASAALLSFALLIETRTRRSAITVLPSVGGGIPGFASFAVLAAAVGLTLAAPFPPRQLLDRTNDPFFAAVAAEQQGMLLTSGTFHLVQLYTRRPVLLDTGGLDSLPYAPESGPAMERILRDVYQVDFFHPPIETKGAGAIPHSFNRPVWERYSRDKWREIGREYNVTQVLSRRDYELDLPVTAETAGLRLYRIPHD